MFKIIKQGEESLYQDVKTGTIYAEFRGAFSWPSTVPGFICVIGQEDKTGILRLYFESYYENIENLARHLGPLQKLYHLDCWVAYRDEVGKSFEEILDSIGESLDQHFLLTHPRLAANFTLAVELLRKWFFQDALILLEEGILENKREQLGHIDRFQPKLEEKFPEIVVLANLIYEFPSKEEVIERGRPKDKWDFDEEPKSDSWMAS